MAISTISAPYIHHLLGLIHPYLDWFHRTDESTAMVSCIAVGRTHNAFPCVAWYLLLLVPLVIDSTEVTCLAITTRTLS